MYRSGFYWTDDIMVKFVKMAILSDEEKKILKMTVQRRTIKEIASEIGMSTSTVSRRLAQMAKKYDNLVEAGYNLPPRKK